MKKENKYKNIKEMFKDKWFWYFTIGYLILVLCAEWINNLFINQVVCK